jgi:alanine racemase
VWAILIEQYGRDTIIQIDLNAFEQNIQSFQEYLPAGTQIMVAVKANAYGHGAIPMAKAAIRAGASYLGVAFVDEGIELRKAGVDVPILILGYTPAFALEDAIKYRLTLTVFSLDQGKAIFNTAQQLDMSATIHIKIDTGMGRIGVQPEEATILLEQLMGMPLLYIEGVYTHLATADDINTEYLTKQHTTFVGVIDELEKKSITIPIIHIANSPGAIQIPKAVFNMVRLGISAYGYYPSMAMKGQIQLTPVLSFKSAITHVKKPSFGCGISYGATYKATGEQWIATIPVGYGDGFRRSFSNKGSVLISGKKVPIVGTVCMDQLMVDVSSVMPVEVGEEVIIYGKQGGEEFTVDEVAQQLDTISYEVTTMLSHRIPRVYLRDGNVVEIVNPLRA